MFESTSYSMNPRYVVQFRPKKKIRKVVGSEGLETEGG